MSVRIAASKRVGIASGLLAMCLVIAPSLASAANQPDEFIIGSKLIIKTDGMDASKNKLVFKSKDANFALPDPSNDPTANGATLRVMDTGLTGGSISLTLDKTRWSAVGHGFKYKGQTGDPCKTILIKDDKLVKAICKGTSVALTLPFSGSAALALVVGNATSIRYCATFTLASVIKNELKPNGKGIFKAKGAPAPAACLSCGNGSLEAGEQCDDGNNANGDCCSATCQFETSGSSCNDSNACTLNDQCDGAGNCTGGPSCGNDTVDAGCNEQCDGSDDGACPNHCLSDCSCAPDPTCTGDPSRTVFVGGPETSGCHDFDGNQIVCNQAFILGKGGVTSCFYDVDSDSCEGCGPFNQAEGLCMNECRPVSCVGDPSRTAFAGGPESGACQNYGIIAGTANCNIAFHIGAYGVASCYYDADADECRGCGPNNQGEGNCVNTCAACEADASRTIFLGGPNTSACHEFDGDEASCNQAFHRDTCGNDTSCFYDSGECRGCGPNNQQDGVCLNTCEVGPLTCTNDPSRTIDAGGPNTQACHQFDGDYVNCQKAFHHGTNTQATSCYYSFAGDECRGCGPNNEFDGECINTCVAGAVTCPQDPSRTVLAGLPNSQGCQEFGVVAGTANCDIAFNIGAGGVASCFNDGFDCRGCGPSNEGNGECRNTCTQGPPACPSDPTRTIFAGGPNTQACHQFDGDQGSCEQAFALGAAGVASCFYDFGSCSGCGPNNLGDCTNTCAPPTCPGDVTRTIFAGGPQTSACHTFDGNQTNCEKAYHQGDGGIVASCYYDTDDDECFGCGPNNEEAGNCTNTCPVCQNDPTRTFAGGPFSSGCSDLDGDQSACQAAFQFDDFGHSVSCFYDGGNCQPCDPSNFSTGDCRNSCVLGPPTCDKDPSRTIFGGGPNNSACHQFDGNPVSCLKAFHQGQMGSLASCFYDGGSGECAGCGLGQIGSDECLNTCQHGVPACSQDPGRTLFAGYPGTAACHAFDGNQAGCESAYHVDSDGNTASCFYDQGAAECRGCGPTNANNGECVNTCRNGPASCPLDPSRIFFAGLPGNSGCIDDLATCLASFNLGQCGITSCYWTGSSCQGCGPPNEFDAQCFNTCQAP
jgi:hypothetical protein